MRGFFYIAHTYKDLADCRPSGPEKCEDSRSAKWPAPPRNKRLAPLQRDIASKIQRVQPGWAHNRGTEAEVEAWLKVLHIGAVAGTSQRQKARCTGAARPDTDAKAGDVHVVQAAH